MGTEMVDITVGPQKKLFRVYKKALCDKVPYFDKMFNSGFKESAGYAHFPADSVESFELLMQWIYSSTLTPLKVHKFPSGSFRFNWDDLSLYALAEKLILKDLMDTVMDQVYDASKKAKVVISLHRAEQVYSSTTEGSSFRRYAIRALRFRSLQPGDSAEDIQNLVQKNQEIGKDFFESLKVPHVFLAYSPYDYSPCDYHHHGKDKVCPYYSEAAKLRNSW